MPKVIRRYRRNLPAACSYRYHASDSARLCHCPGRLVHDVASRAAVEVMTLGKWMCYD
ncbi:MAG: hypothetical protein H6822_00530 [Planctomycetaceae bacterium]|nr:hypothetical protein [Planctomycetales bacterium]MCB9920630.1 hypothetical protein [Planctomycetaceae bacterium]